MYRIFLEEFIQKECVLGKNIFEIYCILKKLRFRNQVQLFTISLLAGLIQVLTNTDLDFTSLVLESAGFVANETSSFGVSPFSSVELVLAFAAWIPAKAILGGIVNARIGVFDLFHSFLWRVVIVFN